MFLAGLKFALGLMTGVFAVFGIVVAFIVVTEWVMDGRKKRRRDHQGMIRQTEVANARRNHLFLLIRYPAWVDEPTESSHRKSEFTQ
jgi:hypothetical protein